MKKSAFAGCVALGALLTSCVDPYATGPTHSTVTTTYRTGYEVRSLPSGYRTETIGGSRYYSHNGTYYQSRSGRYVVVEAPRRGYDNRYDDRKYGSRDRDRRDGHDYRDRDGRDRGRYDGPPRGGRDVIVTRLPSGYRTVNYRGGVYYQSKDVYYQRRGTGYVVVTRPY
ncbi:hypothetical protein GCM10023212_10080 [Luteolibacter yonseiensis]